ncbi:MAG TPA: glutathionylspermidine synthase family protein [Planctomycetota bacterium]|nr:glutathionylspermidine synthase family protein [Planctomycetota bacterium]
MIASLPPLDDAAREAVRRRAIFDCCKWDPQVGDASALAPFPLALEPRAWDELAGAAEALARETLAAEAELLARPDLHGRLGLPRELRRRVAEVPRLGATPGAARVMRFDFHPTAEGWRVSEVNSDVPGGFIESSGIARLVAAHYAGFAPAGDPTRALADAVARATAPKALVGLVHATAYTDDRQVMAYLAKALEARGLRTCLVSPAHLRWEDGRARIACDWLDAPADLLLRFFPAEWLPETPAACGWPHLLRGGRTPVGNPAYAILTQSKRLPLAWDALETPLDAWRALLPETRSPRDAPAPDGAWILKPALGRVGEAIGLYGVAEPKELRAAVRDARWHPGRWVSQRRFESVPVETAAGAVHACVGVFTVDGRAAGAYGRVAPRPLIDGRAQDAAVLVREGSHVV